MKTDFKYDNFDLRACPQNELNLCDKEPLYFYLFRHLLSKEFVNLSKSNVNNIFLYIQSKGLMYINTRYSVIQFYIFRYD